MRENHFSKFLPRWCVRTNQRDGDGVAASWRWSKVEVELLKRKEKKTAKPAEIVGSVCLGGRSDVVATFRFKFASGVVCERRERVRKTVQTTARRVLARRGAACSCSVLSYRDDSTAPHSTAELHWEGERVAVSLGGRGGSWHACVRVYRRGTRADDAREAKERCGGRADAADSRWILSQSDSYRRRGEFAREKTRALRTTILLWVCFFFLFIQLVLILKIINIFQALQQNNKKFIKKVRSINQIK